jgi:hypothetical protein
VKSDGGHAVFGHRIGAAGGCKLCCLAHIPGAEMPKNGLRRLQTEKKLPKIWQLQIKAVPLHPQ